MKGSRKFLSLLLTVAMIFTALPGTGIFLSYADDAAGYTVSMSSDSADVTEGGTFNVTLSVASDSGSAGAAALHSEVKYDNSKIEFVKAGAPAGTELNADAVAENGVVTVESYGQPQTASGSGAAMAVLTFKALNGASGSAQLSFLPGKSLVGVSGVTADIKADTGSDALNVSIKANDVNKFDITFGLPDDGLTWNILTINGEDVNNSYRGGEIAAAAAAPGDIMTFSIKADDDVQYTNVMMYSGIQFSRDYDAFLNGNNGTYTLTVPERKYKSESYSINATTFRTDDNEHGLITASVDSKMQSREPGASSYGTDEIYLSLNAKFIPRDTSRVIGWSYKVSDRGDLNNKTWNDLGYGTANEDGTYSFSRENMPERIYYRYYSGRVGDESNFGFEFKNTCYVLRIETVDETVTSVRTEDDLIKLANAVNDGDPYTGVTVKLENDITLTKPWTTQIGTDAAHPFSGVFDGNDKTISGLDIDYTFTDPDDNDSKSAGAKTFGLFGYTSGAEIKSLTVSGNIDIDNTVKYSGDSDPDASIFEYTEQGGNSNIGGIVGTAGNTSFVNCVNEVDIKAHGGNIGGLVGAIVYNYKGGTAFTDCFNYGSIEVTRRNRSACGIASGIAPDSMLRCGNYGDITIGGTQIKTLVGAPATSGSTDVTLRKDDTATGKAAGLAPACKNVMECFNKGSIKGIALDMAGLIAGSYSANVTQASDRVIKDSYNTGSVELTIDHYAHRNPTGIIAGVSGIIGRVNGTLDMSNCYNSGAVISAATRYGTIGQLYNKADYLTETVTNCYASDTDPSVTGLKAAALNVGDTAKFKDDEGNVNGGMPLLIWEATAGSEEQYDVTFDMKDVKGDVTVYSDAARTQVIDAAGDGRYSLKAGTYYYTAKADGYEDVLGSFSVVRKAVTVEVNFRAVVDVTVTVSPADAELTLETTGGEAVQPKSAVNGVYTFTLYKGVVYKYNAKAAGYNGQGRTFTADGTPVTITLTKSSSSGGETTDSNIYGSYNAGKTSTITKGGTYYIKKGDNVRSQGRITISTSEAVTLIGTGYSDDDMYEDLYIKYTVSGADLTIKDVYIHNTLDCEQKTDMGNIIDFRGSGNKFSFSGTNILDWDGNASGYAAIHVNKSTDLTISASDSDRLYLYKHEQGAGIGGNGGADGEEGQTAETNGNITFNGGTYFIKNSKQGAGIGAGAQAASQKPGSIRFNGGSFYIIANSRGASIGGSAGSGGASAGSDVYISDNASITVNVDFAGAAIGGGGHAGGNDTDGGTVYYGSGSIRTYIDENAVSSWEGVSKAGVNGNKAVTANVVNNSGKQLYLLELDTSKLDKNKSASRFTVKDGSNTVYSGRLHEYRYVNEDSVKSGQDVLSYTIDNWTSLDDTQLYLYVTGDDHTLDVNGETVTAKWDASSEGFTLTYPDGTTGGNTGGGSGGSLNNDKTPLVSEVIKADTKVSGSNSSASVKKDDVDGAVKAVGGNSNAEIIIDAVSGKSGITHVEVSVPMESVKTIQKDTKADIVLKTDLGDITVDNSDLSSLTSGSGSDVTFTIDKNADGSMKLGVTSGGKNIASGKYILRYKYKIDDAVMKSLAGKTGVDNSDLVGVLLGAKGADGNVTQTVIRDSFVTADGYLILNAPVGGTVTVAANGRAFSDVTSSAWYAKSVGFAVSHELFNGVSDNEFAPSKSMTRGMFVTVLSRLAGEENFSGKADFTDVPADAWYAAGTAWAASKGIVNGYGDGRFGPNDPVTREQMAVIMYNFTKAMNYDIKGNAALTKFSDSASVHSWATEAMQWAVGAGVMNGNADGTLNPRGTATRAQVATIMSNYIQVLLGVK